jgi:maltooligosyltrehalose trehalohydrolase
MYPWQRNPRGGPTRNLGHNRFVHFLENHDQVANAGFGERLPRLCDPGTLRALTAVLLLGPELPMLFQGQESGATEPWLFFVDHEDELRQPIRDGRAKFVAQFARLATPEAQAALAAVTDPCDEATFRACVLDPKDRRLDHPTVAMHRELLRMRREDPAFTDGRPHAIDGAVLSEHAFVIRYRQADPRADRLLLVNLGATLIRTAIPEPLLAPPDDATWKLAWSSEDPRYGGHGTPPVFTRARTAIPGRAAVVLAPEPGTSLRMELTPEQEHAPVEP